MIEQLVAPGADSDVIELAYGSLAAGEELALDGAAEAVAVVLSGTVEAWAGEEVAGPRRRPQRPVRRARPLPSTRRAGAPLAAGGRRRGRRRGHDRAARRGPARPGAHHRAGRPEDRHRRRGHVAAQRAHDPRPRRHGVAAAGGGDDQPARQLVLLSAPQARPPRAAGGGAPRGGLPVPRRARGRLRRAGALRARGREHADGARRRRRRDPLRATTRWSARPATSSTTCG